jgi:hypothetical protein
MLLVADFRADFEDYLKGLESTSLKTFEDLRDFKVDDKVKIEWPPSELICFLRPCSRS